ncbi:hypothetical protein G3565_34070 [Escherichia coli]|nr:hypothetical protein [Escherichia coli]
MAKHMEIGSFNDAKNLIEDLTSRFIEQIRARFESNKFSEEVLKKSLPQFSVLNGLYRE